MPRTSDASSSSFTLQPTVLAWSRHRDPENHHIYVVPTVEARQAGERPEPKNIVLVLDTSGSMEGEKIRNTIAAAKRVVDSLAEGDTVSVIAFSHTARVIKQAVTIDGSNKEDIKGAMNGIFDRGTTNIEGAMGALGESIVPLGESGHATVLFLTDGQANSPQNASSIFNSYVGARGEGHLIKTIFIGLGMDYDSGLLNALSGDINRRCDTSMPVLNIEGADSLSGVFAALMPYLGALGPRVVLKAHLEGAHGQQLGEEKTMDLGALTFGVPSDNRAFSFELPEGLSADDGLKVVITCDDHPELGAELPLTYGAVRESSLMEAVWVVRCREVFAQLDQRRGDSHGSRGASNAELLADLRRLLAEAEGDSPAMVSLRRGIEDSIRAVESGDHRYAAAASAAASAAATLSAPLAGLAGDASASGAGAYYGAAAATAVLSGAPSYPAPGVRGTPFGVSASAAGGGSPFWRTTSTGSAGSASSVNSAGASASMDDSSRGSSPDLGAGAAAADGAPAHSAPPAVPQ